MNLFYLVVSWKENTKEKQGHKDSEHFRRNLLLYRIWFASINLSSLRKTSKQTNKK